MHGFIDLVWDVLRNSILITGLVMVMMLMIEYLNIHSEGRLFVRLRKNRFGQVLLGAGLGIIPGCMGGFATVTMFSHNLLSFGALVAMMIASSGDEAFVMLALIPKQALLLAGVLLVVAVAVGLLVDRFSKPLPKRNEGCDEGYQIHEEDHYRPNKEKPTFRNMKHASAERIALLLGVVLFIFALAFGMLEHEGHHDEALHGHLNVFDEYWLNLVFAGLSLIVVYFLATTSEHIIKEHLWEHVVMKHFLSIFLWTFGSLLVIQIGLHYFSIESWISDNMLWMILLAVLIGIIPESGPHLLFVTLFAQGVVPFSVLLASSISQDGHASLPLLAENKRAFLYAKTINVLVAAVMGYALYFMGL